MSRWSWLPRLLPRHTLERLGEGAYCAVPVEVLAQGDDGVEAVAAIHWTLLVEHARGDLGEALRPIALRPIATGWRSDALHVRSESGLTIEIALAHARLVTLLDVEFLDALPLSPERAEELGLSAVVESAQGRPVYLRERSIARGQRFVLRGFVEPRATTSGYREPASTLEAELVVRDELTLEEKP